MFKHICLKYVICLVIPFHFIIAGKNELKDSQLLINAVSLDDIRAHQQALNNIANLNGGNRETHRFGFHASVNYVKEQLVRSGYEVKLQPFYVDISEDNTQPVLRQTSPTQYDFIYGDDFLNITQAGNVELTGEIQAVDLLIPSNEPNSSSSGCEMEDFRDFKPGNIALIQRGSCSFLKKVENAILAKASSAIIFNEGNPGRIEALSAKITPSLNNFAVLGASFATGEILRKGMLTGITGNKVYLKIDSCINSYPVQNVIAETKSGDENRVVVIGSHLDSVGRGPGINDNGSGSSTILVMAQKWAQLNINSLNKVRFIWFAAEELGLLGAEYYVYSLKNE